MNEGVNAIAFSDLVSNITNWLRPKIVKSFSCCLSCALAVMYIVLARISRRNTYKMRKYSLCKIIDHLTINSSVPLFRKERYLVAFLFSLTVGAIYIYCEGRITP